MPVKQLLNLDLTVIRHGGYVRNPPLDAFTVISPVDHNSTVCPSFVHEPNAAD